MPLLPSPQWSNGQADVLITITHLRVDPRLSTIRYHSCFLYADLRMLQPAHGHLSIHRIITKSSRDSLKRDQNCLRHTPNPSIVLSKNGHKGHHRCANGLIHQLSLANKGSRFKATNPAPPRHVAKAYCAGDKDQLSPPSWPFQKYPRKIRCATKIPLLPRGSVPLT